MTTKKYIASVSQNIILDKIELWNNDNLVKTISSKDVLKLHIDTSVKNYIDECIFFINTNDYSFILSQDFEIKVYVFENTESILLFTGYVFKKFRHWNKVNNVNILEIISKSYAYLLVTNIIKSKELKFNKGYGEIVKKLISPLQIFNIENIQLDEEKGSVFFENISVLNALRFVAYTKGWCLKFEGKIIYFKECEEAKHSGYTLNLDDVEQGKIEY